MPIVTDGLLGYWNVKQGVKGDVWLNIAPNSSLGNATLSNVIIFGEEITTQGAWNSEIKIPSPSEFISNVAPFTLEFNSLMPQSPSSLMNIDAIVEIQSGGSWTSFPNESSTVGTWLNGSFGINTYYLITYVYNGYNNLKMYINGNLSFSATTSGTFFLTKSPTMSLGLYNKTAFRSVKLYNRDLTIDEIQQNYNVGADVGLDVPSEPIDGIPPTVSIIRADKYKISDEEGFNQSIITVSFDMDVQSYVARLNGSDYSTGILVDSGGDILKGEEVDIVVDWDELLYEGENRINIYGQSLDGVWTPYQE